MSDTDGMFVTDGICETLYQELLPSVAKSLTPGRWEHTMGVISQAERLAARHGIEVPRAKLAALLHDEARELPMSEMLRLQGDFGIITDEIERACAALLHAPVGAGLARWVHGVEDKEILDSIRYHTTGRPGMGALEKLIYVSDYTAPDREFEGARLAAEAADTDLDRALMLAVGGTLGYLVSERRLIHPRTLETWNWIVGKETYGGSI